MDADLNNDGKLSELEKDLLEQKQLAQKRMAWTAMLSMVLFTLFLFSPYVAVAKVTALGDVLGIFYIAQAGVVGAYMGVTAWLSKK